MEMAINWDLYDFASGILFALISAISYVIKEWSTYRKASKNLGMNIDGQWFSAELDFKQKKLGNAFMKVDIRRKKLGNQVVIKTIQQLNIDEVKHETAWIVNGKVLTESTIVSEFVGPAGYGNAFLRFIGNGRAIGYWVGYSSRYSGQPMYGYWILCKDEKEVKEVAAFALERFQYFDVKYMVEHHEDNITTKDYLIKATQDENTKQVS